MSQIAAQMFTVRDYTRTARDLATTLKKLRQIGYQAAQLSAVRCMEGDPPEVTAAQMRKMLDDHGMRCVATHRSWESLARNPEKEIEFHKTLGCDYAAIGSMAKLYQGKGAAGYRQFLSDSAPVIERLNRAGIRFGYHNHAHEFRRDPDGTRPIDVLVKEGPANLKMEIDTYWVAHAGANPPTFLKRCAGRIDVIHVKDMMLVEGKETFMAPVGEGNLEWDEVLSAARQGGCEWYCVEQDRFLNDRDPFDCLRSSFEFLAGKGL